MKIKTYSKKLEFCIIDCKVECELPLSQAEMLEKLKTSN